MTSPLSSPAPLIEALVDSGAQASVISTHTLRRLAPDVKVDLLRQTLLSNFTGSSATRTIGGVTLPIILPDVFPYAPPTEIPFWVVDLPPTAPHQIILSLGDLIPLNAVVTADGRILAEPTSSPVEPNPLVTVAAVASLFPDVPDAQTLPFLKLLEKVNPTLAALASSPSEDPLLEPATTPSFGDAATSAARQAILDLVRTHPEITASDTFTAAASIPPTPHMPVYRPQLRPGADALPHILPLFLQSPAVQHITRALVQDLIDAGVFVRAPPRHEDPNPFISRAFAVPKPNSRYPPSDKRAWRLVLDLRLVNAAIYDPEDPGSDIRLARASIPADATIFSTLDLRAAYHSLPLHPAAQPLTRFRVHGFPYDLMSTRSSMGLKTSASHLSLAMQTLTEGLDGVIVYADDILIATANLEDHLAALQTVLRRASELGFQISWSKSTLMSPSVEWLGVQVRKGGLHVSDSTRHALDALQAPQSRKDLRSLLGFVTWMRPFLRDASSRLEPLYDALNTPSRSPFTWSSECQAALEDVKTSLGEATTSLSFFPPAPGPLFLHTDASETHIGAVLSTPDRHPIAFWSTRLTDAQRRYSITDKEALALVMAVQKFDSVSRGYDVIAFTDHKPLTHVFAPDDVKPRADRITRWALFLAQRSISVRYVPGPENAAADTLSRPIPGSPTASDTLDAASPSDIPGPSILSVSSFPEPPPHADTPPGPVPDVADAADQGHALDHAGPTALAARLVASGYPVRAASVAARRAYGACPSCARNKPHGSRPRTLFRSHPRPPGPNVLVYMDAIGPFPDTESGSSAIMMIDAFSRWTQVTFLPSRGVSGKDFADAVTAWSQAYGPPLTVVSDRASSLISSHLAHVFQRFGITHHRTTAYHPAANGQGRACNPNVERSGGGRVGLLADPLPLPTGPTLR